MLGLSVSTAREDITPPHICSLDFLSQGQAQASHCPNTRFITPGIRHLVILKKPLCANLYFLPVSDVSNNHTLTLKTKQTVQKVFY